MDDNELCSRAGEIIAQRGFELIECTVYPQAGGYTIRCLADRPEGGITVAECASLNRDIVEYLATQGQAYENYSVEVNSPGLDRVLKDRRDFLRVKGRTVMLWLKEPVSGTAYLEGDVVSADNEALTVVYKGETLRIQYSLVKAGKEKVF